MTSTAPTARRLVLVPASGRGDEIVRRYRLARLRLDPPPRPSSSGAAGLPPGR